MKIMYNIALGLVLSTLVLNGKVVDFVSQQGNYLAHTSNGQLLLNNPSTSNSIFLTSDQGQGYQKEFGAGDQPNLTTAVQVGSNPASLIECQQPLGHPVACVSRCSKNPSFPAYWGTTQCKAPVLNASYSGSSASVATDLLNENGTKDIPSLIFLDSLINNSNATYSMAITTAPLYQAEVDPTDGSIKSASNTIAGALASTGFNFINNIYSLAAQVTPTSPVHTLNLQPGSATSSSGYTIQFPSLDVQTNFDLRYTLFGKNQNNPAARKLSTKKHMALVELNMPVPRQLALSTDNTGIQTIILYPHDPFTTCQPVIFIGKDNTTNIFYALTYLIMHTTEEGMACCVQSDGSSCPNDTLYCPESQQTAGGCALVSANEDGAILSGTPARLRVTIDPFSTNPAFGYASSIEVLPGYWWPGQPDFDVSPAPAPFNGGGATVVPLAKTSAYVPQKKVMAKK